MIIIIYQWVGFFETTPAPDDRLNKFCINLPPVEHDRISSEIKGRGGEIYGLFHINCHLLHSKSCFRLSECVNVYCNLDCNGSLY